MQPSPRAATTVSRSHPASRSTSPHTYQATSSPSPPRRKSVSSTSAASSRRNSVHNDDDDEPGLPFELLIYDYRPGVPPVVPLRPPGSRGGTTPPSPRLAAGLPPVTSPGSTSPPPRPVSAVKIVQWNIERGYQLDKVIDVLVRVQPDVVCLQELDIGCARSNFRNCAQELAQALRMKCAFAAEFVELPSSVRSARDSGGGVHGNAILSRWDFAADVMVHKYQVFDWERDGMGLREPRRGGRCTVVGEVQVPGWTAPLVVYSVHLEIFCGMLGRVAQFSEILAHASATKKSHPFQVIGGDLNTMAHGIARLSPKYCQDKMRWKSLGSTEAEWFTQHVLAQPPTVPFNPALLSLNLPPDVLSTALNCGFFDPFDPVHDVTLSSYGGYFQGKLDWTLCMGLDVADQGMANLAYDASDHRLLHVTVRPDLEERGYHALLDEWAATDGEGVRRRRKENGRRAWWLSWSVRVAATASVVAAASVAWVHRARVVGAVRSIAAAAG